MIRLVLKLFLILGVIAGLWWFFDVDFANDEVRVRTRVSSSPGKARDLMEEADKAAGGVKNSVQDVKSSVGGVRDSVQDARQELHMGKNRIERAIDSEAPPAEVIPRASRFEIERIIDEEGKK
jgi:hypothetical protein